MKTIRLHSLWRSIEEQISFSCEPTPSGCLVWRGSMIGSTPIIRRCKKRVNVRCFLYRKHFGRSVNVRPSSMCPCRGRCVEPTHQLPTGRHTWRRYRALRRLCRICGARVPHSFRTQIRRLRVRKDRTCHSGFRHSVERVRKPFLGHRLGLCLAHWRLYQNGELDLLSVPPREQTLVRSRRL